MTHLLREFCTQGCDHIAAAVAAGAARIELCADLSVGGVTPSEDDVRRALRVCTPHEVPVMVIIRPRGGSFVYSRDEVTRMCATIDRVRELGASGVVLGALTADGSIDEEAMTQLLMHCGDTMSTTFHMAFDHVNAEQQPHAIDWLAAHKVDRILTHGSAQPGPIETNLPRLRSFVRRAAGRIAIMPGGGVTWRNCEQVAAQLGVCEVHGTRIVNLQM